MTASVHMKTPGLVVLADNWDQGWRACWNDKPVPVLQTDYAIRGVVILSACFVVNLTRTSASQARAIEANYLS